MEIIMKRINNHNILLISLLIILAAETFILFLIYKKNIELNNKLYKTYLSIAIRFSNEDDYEKVIRCYEDIIEKYPYRKDAYRFLAAVYEDKKMYEEALFVLNRGLLKFNIKDYSLNLLAGRVYKKTNDYEKSLMHLENAEKDAPDSNARGMVLLQMAHVYDQMGNIEESCKYLASSYKVRKDHFKSNDKAKRIFNQISYDNNCHILIK